jgi:S-adenosylmethionine synthetase
MEVVLSSLRTTPADGPVEIVERKGVGHPDTICDALAEQASVALCRAYRERCGAILHHNVDKALLRGGAARPAFRGGAILAPIEIYLAGRATSELGDGTIPVAELVEEACRACLRGTLHALDVERHVRIAVLTRPGSSDLRELYGRAGGRWLANDTSIGVGVAPATELEQLVLAVTDRLALVARGEMPEVGEDVKVMGVRRDARILLTVACAFVDRFVSDAADYVAKKARVAEVVCEAARGVTARAVEVAVNAADDAERGSFYLTVTGSSAEAGDDGQVGRGNRVTGLITPYRAMSLEAVAGKNPVTHVGKLYNVVGQRIAAALVEELADVGAAECHLVSRIGRPVDDPLIADLRLRTADGAPLERLERPAEEILRRELARLPDLLEEIVAGRVRLF